MNDQEGVAKTIELLSSLLQRLDSPELTLPEAKLLRCQITQVLRESSSLGCDSRTGNSTSVSPGKISRRPDR
jgi:hypothetical protein